MLLFQIGEMKQMSKGRGVIVMGLEKDEKLRGGRWSPTSRSVIVAGVARGGKEKEITITA